MVGRPSTIHSASALPAPPADWMPIELKPQATKKPLSSGRFAEMVAVVRGEALGAAEELPDADPLERRDAPHGVLEERHEVVPVLGQLAELELLRDALGGPGFGDRLEHADQELAGILLDVEATVRVAQHRQVPRQLRHRLGQDVEVLARLERHVDAGHAPDLAPPHAGAVDHDLGGDRPALGEDAGDPAVCPGDAGDFAALDDRRTAHARAFGQRLGDVDRVGLAVRADEDRPDQVADLEQRIARPGLGGRDHLDLEAEGRGHRSLTRAAR